MANDHADIAALCQRLGDAHRDKDADAIVDCYAPDAVVYSLAPPLKNAMQRDDIAAWLETWDGPILVDVQDMDMVVGGDLAWVTALNHMTGTKVDGKQEDLWFRATLCFRKNGGVWKIVHDHSSTPFYMDASLRAAVDLRP